MHETPLFLMLGRKSTVSVNDIIFDIYHVVRISNTTENFIHFTSGNLQIAFELAREILSERNNTQKAARSK